MMEKVIFMGGGGDEGEECGKNRIKFCGEELGERRGGMKNIESKK